jgi:glycosyltransferase involved in cell wall biosynthesis
LLVSRPQLLFVSPVYPDTQGNGLAMRAGMFIEMLAQRHDVSLLLVPAFGDRSESSEAFLSEYCAAVFEVTPHAPAWWRRLRVRHDDRPALARWSAAQAPQAVRALRNRDFDVIHAFRVYMAPLARALAAARAGRGRTPRLHLDVDDVESVTHQRRAGLYSRNGLHRQAAFEEAEARAYRAFERIQLPSFDRLYVCSTADARLLAGGAELCVAPNAIRIPVSRAERQTSHPHTFLFVGTLDYYPNLDAARYFCLEVLPRLRALAPAPFLVRVVGRVPHDAAALAGIPEVRLAGHVPDLAPEYAEADTVVVPVRAGGGTRIKVLEAFAHLRPVVSTSIGVESIEVEAGRHYLEADSPDLFASRCVELMATPELGEELAGNAAALLESRYTQARLNALAAEWR